MLTVDCHGLRACYGTFELSSPLVYGVQYSLLLYSNLLQRTVRICLMVGAWRFKKNRRIVSNLGSGVLGDEPERGAGRALLGLMRWHEPVWFPSLSFFFLSPFSPFRSFVYINDKDPWNGKP